MPRRNSPTLLKPESQGVLFRTMLVTAAAFLVTGCNVGPKYVVPTAPVPPAYKELGPNAFKEGENTNWTQAKPIDAIPRGAWWTIFNDPQLNDLEPKVEQANQTLRQADANLRAARAEITVRKADRYPTIGINSYSSTSRYSPNSPYFNPAQPQSTSQTLQYPLQFSYEVDLWGQVRKNIAAGVEESQATAADRVNILLSLQTELAVDYFEVRSADAQQKLLNDTVAQYQEALRITTNRYLGGVAIKADVTQAQTQLESARVAASDEAITRAQYEHAIANLIGEAPAALTIPFSPLPVDTQPPVLPTGLPSQLLERRPDIAAAERRAQEGNEAIGIAQSAFYPQLVFGASAGYQSTASLQSVFSPASVVYSLGPGIAYTFFEGGRRHGIKTEALAQFDRNAANYKQTVITAFQQTEDNLVALRVLADEQVQQRNATNAALESQRIFNNRYVGGVDTFLQVITAQTSALAAERNDIDILRRRMDATVNLVKALGGGWDRTQLPPS
jgi:NodT family efflux transporter outer membrane factor (OMF) lipoprotein